MHEAAMMRGAVQEALGQMPAADGTQITRVVLVLGASGHFTEDVARQHFALNALATPAEDAVLEIEWLPATYSCFACLHTFASVLPAEAVTCPACGGVALEVGHADVCYIREIEVEKSPIASEFTVPAPLRVNGKHS
jgi:Zn finger protein HypA/HybF involved in hydrogenase expression